MNWLNSLFNKFYFYASLLLLCKPLGVAGFCSSVTQSKFLICESSDSLFFFCFLTSDAGRPSSGWPVLLLGVVWINGCFNRPFNSYTHQLAQLDGVSSRGWTSCRWCSLARFSGGVASRSGTTQTLERSSGTRRLRNLCKDAIQFHTYLANFEYVWNLNILNILKRIVATWLILPVVICLS